MNIETTASMQEQLARRDHRIAVLEAICAAQTFRLAVLETREGNDGSSVPQPSVGLGLGLALALSRAIAADKPLDAYGRR